MAPWIAALHITPRQAGGTAGSQWMHVEGPSSGGGPLGMVSRKNVYHIAQKSAGASGPIPRTELWQESCSWAERQQFTMQVVALMRRALAWVGLWLFRKETVGQGQFTIDLVTTLMNARP